jgi:hypothetical protein
VYKIGGGVVFSEALAASGLDLDLPALMATRFVGDHMEVTLSGVQTSIYLVVLTVAAWYAASMVFYTDGSLIDGCAGFAFHRTGEGGFCYNISSPVVF